MGRFLSAVLRTKSNDLSAVYKSAGWLPFLTESGDLDMCSMTNTSEKHEICYISANSAPRLTKTINLLLELLFVKPTLCSGVSVSSVVETLKNTTFAKFRQYFCKGDYAHISTFMCEVHRRQELEWWYCELCTLENVKPMQFDIFREDLCKTLKIQVMVDQKNIKHNLNIAKDIADPRHWVFLFFLVPSLIIMPYFRVQLTKFLDKFIC